MRDPNTLAKAAAVQTQEEERYRLARSLQSGPGQLMANAAVEIETCLSLMDDQPEAARKGLTALLAELRQGLASLRDMIRELQPPLLVEFGLGTSLQKYADDFTLQTGIVVSLQGWETLTERLPATVEVAVFRIVQEALENVREHARARHAEVKWNSTSDRLIVTITDDGQGFDASQGINPGRRLGLVAMRDRAELLGGSLQVFSDPGEGVRVVLTAPMHLSASSTL